MRLYRVIGLFIRDFARRCRGKGLHTAVIGHRLATDIIAAFQIVDLFRDRPKSEFPDVLVCENDALAMGAIDAIRFEFGLRVPEDIAVSGFDNTPQSSSPHYELTTYRQPLTEMAEALVDVLDGKKRTEKLHAFLGNLIIRKGA